MPTYTHSASRHRFIIQTILCIVGLGVSVPRVSAQVPIKPRAQMLRETSQFQLATPSPVVLVNVNELRCLVDPNSVCDGAYWPGNTDDQYVFGSGMELTGIISAAAGCTQATRNSQKTSQCFAWSGDTVGAFQWDNSGNIRHTRPITQFYDSRDSADLSAWPQTGSIPFFPDATAFITDTAVFDASLIGRKSISEHDTWGLLWDDPSVLSARTHAMGISIEQRTLAWNYPSGNEAIIYVIYKITNMTNNPKFQEAAQARHFGGLDSLPDGGWRYDSLYFSWVADPDVGQVTNNQMTAVMPLNMMMTYEGSFNDPGMSYPAAQYHPPFFGNAPGFSAMSLVRTPVNKLTGTQLGMTVFSQNTGGGAFPEPNSVGRAWRYSSLNLDQSRGDANCTFPLAQAKARRICYVGQVRADVHGFMSSGPFSLDPGKSETIIVAQYAAATVSTPLLSTTATGDNPPGIPLISPGCDGPLRNIEVGAGIIAPRQCTGTPLRVSDISVVPGSAAGRALVARSIADAKFVMPAAPEAPIFSLVAGDRRINVVWEPSATETAGDPFYALASDSLKGFYDPNYRKLDVEGYRIYKGTSPTSLKLIAQFDKAGTELTDFTCVTLATHSDGTPCTRATTHVPLNGSVIQYKHVSTSNVGAVTVLEADTAFAARIRAGTAQELSDTRIPYGFIDTDVQNGFPYYYKVTAFDFNSIRTSPSSLESTGEVKGVYARAASTALTSGSVTTGLFGRGKLLHADSLPTIDPVTGTFSGPMPPTNELAGEFTAFAEQLIAAGTRSVRIDSVIPGVYTSGVVAKYFLDLDGTKTTVSFTAATVTGGQGSPGERLDLAPIPIASDPSVRATLVARGVDAPAFSGRMTTTIGIDRPHWNSRDADWVPKQGGFFTAGTDIPTGAFVGGSRWFDGANETLPDPTTAPYNKHGALMGITRIFQPTPYAALVIPAGDSSAISRPDTLAPYRGSLPSNLSGDVFRRFYSTTFGVTRAADMKVYWRAGKVDSVIDVTHNVPVPFSGATRASYGFLADNDGDGKLTYGDFYYLDGLQTSPNPSGGLNQANEINPLALQAKKLVTDPVVMTVDGNNNLVAEGTGFGLYIAGEPYFFIGTPPASAVWTLRTYNGSVLKSATGEYSFTSSGRNPPIPGLSFSTVLTAPAVIAESAADLSKVHTVPDPYYANSSFEASGTLQFVNLPPRAIVRIYSLSGVLVHTLKHDDATGGGRSFWDLRAPNGEIVASGVYYFHVATPEGRTHVGKFTVITPAK